MIWEAPRRTNIFLFWLAACLIFYSCPYKKRELQRSQSLLHCPPYPLSSLLSKILLQWTTILCILDCSICLVCLFSHQCGQKSVVCWSWQTATVPESTIDAWALVAIFLEAGTLASVLSIPPPFFNVLNEDRTQGLTHARYMLCLWNPFPALGLLLSQICSSLEIFCHKSLGERGAVRIKAISDLRQKQWSVQPHIWHALLHMYHKEQSPVGMHTGPQMLCCNNGEFNYLLWREVEEFLNSLY